MSTALAEKQPTLISAPLTPMEMLNSAVQSGAGIDVLEKLMALQERWEKNQARKAFDQAVASAKAQIEPVVKNRQGHNTKYADFAAIARAVDPVITRHGLSYRFRTMQADARISVTCILSHRDGHFEETTLCGPADTSGSKNAIQAIGSTLTYLQRYSLVQMLGLAAANDDDGKAMGSAEPITDTQADKIREMITDTGSNLELFLKHLKAESVSDIPQSKYADALALLGAKAAQKLKQKLGERSKT